MDLVCFGVEDRREGYNGGGVVFDYVPAECWSILVLRQTPADIPT